MEKQEHKTNRLINSSSPYLRQHAHNPVDWFEWGEAAFEKAQSENKLLLVSIGYSACHWCHVMAHESFEDEETAAIMNKHFVCVKVDREELPDVDQIYMDACQLVNGSGGWPLNAFALPDKRPIHALTYLPKVQWQKLLANLSNLWQNNEASAYEYAEKLSAGIVNMSLPPSSAFSETADFHTQVLGQYESQYDMEYGGHDRAPKFPLPNNQWYLLQHAQLYQSESANKMVAHTLTQMYLGGIHDAVGGGFARYSVDKKWFAPHFEKMLYDNAQLIGVYAYASAISGRKDFKQIAYKTIQFCERELKGKHGLMYSAFDADSEGVEGLYYTYTYDELSEVLGDDTIFFTQYFQCQRDGNWEEGRNILYAIDTIEKAAANYEMTPELFETMINTCLEKLKSYREKRVGPGLDDKCILSWNALYLKGLAQAGRFLRDETIVKTAIELEKNIDKHFNTHEQWMRIASKGANKIPAFLEDYASLIDGYIELYQSSFEETYLKKAYALCELCLTKFYDQEKGFFKFSSGEQLITPKYDTSDDVINSGNSMMAHNLFKLSWYFDRSEWRDMAIKLLQGILPMIERSAPWYSNWASLMNMVNTGMQQIIVSRPEERKKEFLPDEYQLRPNAILGYAGITGDIPLFEHKYFREQALLYICINQTCMAPEPYG
ncbi:MAG: thioredoxin domain-containing protein [Chitinophagaceae bacterium]